MTQKPGRGNSMPWRQGKLHLLVDSFGHYAWMWHLHRVVHINRLNASLELILNTPDMFAK